MKISRIGCFVLGLLLASSVSYAGIKLEKDVPLKSLSGVPNTVSFKLYDSASAPDPVAEQAFTSGKWSADYDFTKYVTSPQENVRFNVDFTNTGNLTKNMSLWVEVEVNGTVKGNREQIKKEAWAMFAQEANKADYASTAADADTLDGVHAADLEESAEINNKIAAHTLIPDAHHKKTTSFSELTDSAADAQIPDDITVNNAANADKLNGKTAAEIMASGVPSGYSILGDSSVAPSGYTNGGYFELYPNNNNPWSSKRTMPTARYQFGSAVSNGKIYIIGGNNNRENYLNSNEEYDPVLNNWLTKTPMPVALTSFGCDELNGKIYAIGGFDSSYSGSNINLGYDPANNTWQSKAPMQTKRLLCTATAVNGKIYVIGGYNNGMDSAYYISINEEYDPVTDTWTTKNPIPTGRQAHTAVALDGKIYVIGGETSSGLSNVNEVYDPVTDTWTTKAPMQYARYGAASTVLNGKIYVVGGTRTYNEPPNLSVNEEYDPVSDTWITKPSMLTERKWLGAETVNGKIYAIGGALDNIVPSSINEEYDPTSVKYFIFRKE